MLTDEALADVDGLTVFPTADLTPGEIHTVTLRVVDEGGKSATDSVIINIDDAEPDDVVDEPSVTILSPHPSGSDSPWEEGVLFPFEARVSDDQDSAELLQVTISIVNPDGEMARMPDLEKFCVEHDLKMCSVEQVIEYRLAQEALVERIEPLEGREVVVGLGQRGERREGREDVGLL